jgi:hypothetical protein
MNHPRLRLTAPAVKHKRENAATPHKQGLFRFDKKVTCGISGVNRDKSVLPSPALGQKREICR